VDHLRFFGMFVPNESISFIVPLDKVIVFSPLHIHRQNRISSVAIALSMTLFPTSKSGVE